MVTCHALHCPNPALPGLPQCYDHWMMLPAKVRESRPWVRKVDATCTQSALQVEQERGQMELFA